MNRNFDSNTLRISVYRSKLDAPIQVEISSDYAFSSRKSRLNVNGQNLATEVEEIWAKLKTITRKITKLRVGFDEIDYYDNMNNVYETPVIILEKGKSKAKIVSREHGSIPKDWEICLSFQIEGVKQKKVIIEAIKCILGYKFTQKNENELSKINLVLSGKQNSISCYNEEEED